MGLLSLVRDNPKTGEGGMPGRVDDVVGRMSAPNDHGVPGANLCETVENVKYLIPFGLWDLVLHDSENHPETIRIDIPGWSNVLIHRGDLPTQSKACVLVPKEIEDWLRDNVRRRIALGERWQLLVHEPPKHVI